MTVERYLLSAVQGWLIESINLTLGRRFITLNPLRKIRSSFLSSVHSFIFISDKGPQKFCWIIVCLTESSINIWRREKNQSFLIFDVLRFIQPFVLSQLQWLEAEIYSLGNSFLHWSEDLVSSVRKNSMIFRFEVIWKQCSNWGSWWEQDHFVKAYLT